MIRITKGVYGVNRLNSKSAPFALTEEEEARLVSLGVAEYVPVPDAPETPDAPAQDAEQGAGDETPDAPAQDAEQGEKNAEPAAAAQETASAVSDKGEAEKPAKAPKQPAKTTSKGKAQKAAKK